MQFLFISFVSHDDLYNAFQTSKLIFLGFSVAAVVLIAAIRSAVKQQLVILLNEFDILFIILFCYILINRYYLSSAYSFSNGYTELLGLAIVYIFLRQYTLAGLTGFFIALLFSGIGQAIWGSLQLYGLIPRKHEFYTVTGSFPNPAPFAGYLAALFPAALGLLVYRKQILFENRGFIKLFNSRRPRLVRTVSQIVTTILPIAFIITASLILPIAGSRASLVAVSAGLMMLIAYRYRLYSKIAEKKTAKKYLAAALAVLVIACSSTGLYYLKKASADGRLLVWKITAKMIKERPVTGYGFDRFQSNYMDFQAGYFKDNFLAGGRKLADNINYAFNDPLQFLCEEGLAGFLLLLIIAVFFGRNMLDVSPKRPAQVISIPYSFSISALLPKQVIALISECHSSFQMQTHNHMNWILSTYIATMMVRVNATFRNLHLASTWIFGALSGLMPIQQTV